MMMSHRAVMAGRVSSVPSLLRLRSLNSSSLVATHSSSSSSLQHTRTQQCCPSCATAAAFSTSSPAPSSSTNSTPPPSSAAASSESSPSNTFSLSPESEVRWLYRVFLKHARAMSDTTRRRDAHQEITRQFREKSSELNSKAAAATDSQQRAEDLQHAIKVAYSKLSFTRMSTPKIDHPKLDHIPPFPGALDLFGLREGRTGSETYVYVGGEIMPGYTRPNGRSITNSQGITDDQIKRHHALVERMQFRGPHWAGKSKY